MVGVKDKPVRCAVKRLSAGFWTQSEPSPESRTFSCMLRTPTITGDRLLRLAFRGKSLNSEKIRYQVASQWLKTARVVERVGHIDISKITVLAAASLDSCRRN